MKVKNIFEYMKDYDPEEEISCIWFTREDAERWTDEQIDDEMWNYIIDEVDINADDITYAVQHLKKYRKEKLIEDARSVSR